MIFIILMDCCFCADVFCKCIAIKYSIVIETELLFRFGVCHYNGLGFGHIVTVKEYAFIFAETIKTGMLDSLLLFSCFGNNEFIYKICTVTRAICKVCREISYFIVISKWFGIMKITELP